MSEVNKTYRDLVKEWYEERHTQDYCCGCGESYLGISLGDLYELVDRLGRDIFQEGYIKGALSNLGTKASNVD